MNVLVKPEAIATFSTPGFTRTVVRTGADISNYGFKNDFLGNEDPYLNIDVAHQFHTLFSNSSLHSVDLAAHFVQLDKPDEVTEIIMMSEATVR